SRSPAARSARSILQATSTRRSRCRRICSRRPAARSRWRHRRSSFPAAAATSAISHCGCTASVSSSTRRGWERFAAREPYFAAVTDPRFLRANLTPEHERRFFASGESLVAWMLGVIDAGLAPRSRRMSPLEFGCGPGRRALPLAQRPGTVVAVDRSPAMLDRARAEAERRGLGHIAFERPEDLFAAPRTFDLVVCYHVLQRLPRAEGLALLRRLLASGAADRSGAFP